MTNVLPTVQAGTSAEEVATNFHKLVDKVKEMSGWITTDAGEWEKYAEICNDARDKGIHTYATRCSTELWTDGSDQSSWSTVKGTAAAAIGQDDHSALIRIFNGFLAINDPSHNNDEWNSLRDLARSSINLICATFESGTSIPFVGTDTRARREIQMSNLKHLPTEISSTHLIKRAGFPAHYTELAGKVKICHVEYFMRLDVIDPEGCAYFILTHSQNNGGYVGLVKVDGAYVGQDSRDHVITLPDSNFAGAVVWWDLLNSSHPGGCNHPGNGGQITPGSGGQIGPIAVIVGQDWTKSYGPFHAVNPVGHGSKVLFYDFSCLASGNLPTQTPAGVTSAYMGCLTTEQLNLSPGDDGEISSVNIEQGPDGRFYLIAGNKYQTVLWTSASLVPDISQWKQVPIFVTNQLNDGSSMLAWILLDNGEKSLCYVQSSSNGMDFRQLKYMVVEGEVVGVNATDIPIYSTHQSDMFGDDDWVADNGSFYIGVGKGVALHGVYKSINDNKGPSGQEEPCIQVRAWYS